MCSKEQHDMRQSPSALEIVAVDRMKGANQLYLLMLFFPYCSQREGGLACQS